MTDLRLHDYAASANCYKVRLLLAQLGLDCERVPVDIFAGDTLGSDYAARNPARETPVLEVEGRFLPESGAILAYLAEGTETPPREPWERAHVLRWLLFEQTQVMGTIGGLRFRALTGRLDPDTPAAERRRQASRAALEILDRHLADRTFLAADRYTIADIAVFGYAHVAGEAGIDLGEYPAVQRWIGAVTSTPGFMNDLTPYPAHARPRASWTFERDGIANEVVEGRGRVVPSGSATSCARCTGRRNVPAPLMACRRSQSCSSTTITATWSSTATAPSCRQHAWALVPRRRRATLAPLTCRQFDLMPP